MIGRIQRFVLLAGALTTGTACGPGEPSIMILFPNQAVREATVQIRVEAYTPDTGAAAAADRDCGDFLNLASDGKSPLGSPVFGIYSCPSDPCKSGWMEGEELPKVPSGRQIIYVLTYATKEEGATPILEGCSDRFDSKGGGDEAEEVPIELELVLPESSRLEKAAGDRQVGRAGQELAVPLMVRVEADSPTEGGTYTIPGVSVTFESQDDTFKLVGDNDKRITTHTNAVGTAEVRVLLPNSSKSGTIVAESADLEEITTDRNRFRVEFSVSVTEPPEFPSVVLINRSADHPVAVQLGNVTGGPGADMVVLSCNGSVDGCRRGIDAIAPLGTTRMEVIADVNTTANPAVVSVPTEGFGVLPADLIVESLISTNKDDIAVLNSRRADCQSRVCPPEGYPCPCFGVAPGDPCPCEGSEILIFNDADANDTVELVGPRHTMTGSNGIGLTTFVRQGAHDDLQLAMAAQGRSVNKRPCGCANRCLPYFNCDPRADPDDCENENEAACGGIDGCVWRLETVDEPAHCEQDCRDCTEFSLEVNTWVQQNNHFECGCPPAQRCECSGTTPAVSRECEPPDMLDVDADGIPDGLDINCDGELDQEFGRCIPRDKMVDLLTFNNGPLNEGGCQRSKVICDNSDPEQMSTCECYDDDNNNQCGGKDGCNCKIPDRIYIGDTDAPVLPYGVSSGATSSVDDWDIVVASVGGLELIEAKSGGGFAWKSEPIINAPIHAIEIVNLDDYTDNQFDAVWYSREKCLVGTNFGGSCPVWRELPAGEEEVACLGVYYTDNQPSIFNLRPPHQGGCRRHALNFRPDGMCHGDFNGDSFIDVAIASADLTTLTIFSGDGRGGLLDPPEQIPLPSSGKGGPIACGLVDGDSKEDVAVVDSETGAIYLLKTSP